MTTYFTLVECSLNYGARVFEDHGFIRLARQLGKGEEHGQGPLQLLLVRVWKNRDSSRSMYPSPRSKVSRGRRVVLCCFAILRQAA